MGDILAMLVENVNSFARCATNSDAIHWRMAKESKKLEDWQIADAARLRALFKERAKKSQAAFGADHGIGTQGMVWQYLDATRPLNLDALMKFADGLGVKAKEISPTLWGRIESYFYSESKDERVLLSDEQKRFISLVERMTPEAKAGWLALLATVPEKTAHTPTDNEADKTKRLPSELGHIPDTDHHKHSDPDLNEQIEQPHKRKTQ